MVFRTTPTSPPAMPAGVIAKQQERVPHPTLTRLSVEYYRSFYDRQSIEFAQPNKTAGSGLTVLVGPNNCGKTTALSALRMFVTHSKLTLDSDEKHDKPAKLNLQTSAQEISISYSGLSGSRTPGKWSYPTFNDLLWLPSHREWAVRRPPQSTPRRLYWEYNSAWNDVQVAAQSLVGRLNHINDSGRRPEFDDILKQMIPTLGRWEIQQSDGKIFIEYETQQGGDLR